MDFNDTPDEKAWRDECQLWLSDNLPKLAEHPTDQIVQAKTWQALKFDAGFAKVVWERNLGGRDGTQMQQIIFNQEQARHKVPPDLFRIGIDFIAPTLRAHGTEQQKDRYLPRLLRGDEVWCQMFSEPNAGSDVASLSTSAWREGDEWVLNGQKVWTSYAHLSDFAEVLCRTNGDVPKHRGITAFILDLRSPGITIRRLRQMTGTADFDEVFLDNVRVPSANLIGEVDQGWHVAVTTLANERSSVGSGSGGGAVSTARILADLAGAQGEIGPVNRQRITDTWIRSEIARFLGMRVLTAASQGGRPGPEGSVAKLMATKLRSDVATLALDLLGSAGVAGDQFGKWQRRFLNAPGWHIGGGTDEVNKNIIAERVLGLPSEPSGDRKLVPESEIP